MRQFFNISGYWKDNEALFGDYIVTNYDDCPEGVNDDDIFYYGLSEENLKNSSLDDALDFVVTHYEDVTNQFINDIV